MDYNAQMGDSQYQQHQQDPYYAAPTGTGHSAADYAGYAQPGYPATQPALAQSAYADNMPASEFDLHQGYAQREGFAYPAPAASTRNGNFDFMRAKWPAAFMIVTGVQAILGLCFEAYVFGQFEAKARKGDDASSVSSQKKTIPTFLTLFIFGFLYELVVVWDALRMKNTIQVIGVCIANLALMVYTAVQVDQIRDALEVLHDNNALAPGVTAAMVWGEMEPFLVAIPAILAVTTMCMSFISWKLYQKFAWDILKNIGADYRMKKRFFYYQVYIALLKFDFFFFLGFIVQFVVIVAQKANPEFALTIASIPVTIIILLAAAWFTRTENKPGMIIVIILYFGGLAYFIFKLVRVYEPGFSRFYVAVSKSLTAFAVITILLIILTITNAIICIRNFDKGLKGHLTATSRKRLKDEPDLNSIGMSDVKQQTMPSRMTID